MREEKIEMPRQPRPTSEQLDREVTSLARLWNRSHKESRLDFMEMASEAKGGLIEP